MGDIQVSALTIKPGVTVLFDSNYVFEVAGTLQAVGKSDAPILFTATNGGWQGIYFNYSSPGSEMAYCIVSNSVNSGIRILNSTPYFENCVVANNYAASGGGGIWADIAEGDLTLRSCTIANNQSGTDARGIFAAMHTNRLVLEYCTIWGNLANPGHSSYSSIVGGGIWAEGESPTLRASIVLNRCLVSSNICSGGAARVSRSDILMVEQHDLPVCTVLL